MRVRQVLYTGIAAAAALALACSSDDNTVTGTGPGQGALDVRIKDHPFWFDSVAAVNVFVVRIDARVAVADSDAAEVEDDDADHDFERHHEGSISGDTMRVEHDDDDFAWVTIAEPDTLLNLLDLQNGVTALLGTAVVDTGTFRGLRLVIDPSQSTITLKDGTVLSGDASPFSRFHRGERRGIKIILDHDLHIRAHRRSIVIVDFDLEHSFLLRGTRFRDGFLFSPLLKAAIND